MAQSLAFFLRKRCTLQHVDFGIDDGQRRAKLMRSIAHKVAQDSGAFVFHSQLDHLGNGGFALAHFDCQHGVGLLEYGGLREKLLDGAVSPVGAQSDEVGAQGHDNAE